MEIDRRVAELEREAEYNFHLYQDAANEMFKQAERISELEAIIDMEKSRRDEIASAVAAEREACIEDVRTVGGKFSVECETLIRSRGES